MRDLLSAVEDFDITLLRLAEISQLWAVNFAAIKSLPSGQAGPDDLSKLALFRNQFLALLQEYSFSSFPLQNLEIDSNTFRPTREGFDLGFDIAASDNIRIIWAYVEGPSKPLGWLKPITPG